MTDLAAYPHRMTIPTRWNDNDVYGHVNNVEYYAFFDTIINAYLIEQGGLDILAGADDRPLRRIALQVHRGARLPRAGRGRAARGASWATRRSGTRSGSSARGARRAAATGWFVHVFVDRESRRPRADPATRSAPSLERLA